MKEYNTMYVGIDSHKDEHQVYILDSGESEGSECTVKNTKKEIQRFVRRLKKKAKGPIRMCYEAGPCGFDLQRILKGEEIDCEVVAPSLIPIKPGERIKTDRRDAKKLAHYYRQGLLTPVHAPNEEEEGIRELCRCREAAKETEKRARHQLAKFLLRHGHVYTEGRMWTQKFGRWLQKLKFNDAPTQYTFENYVAEVEHGEARVQELDQEIQRVAETGKYKELVGWLRCYRGIDTVTAMIIVSELFSFERFNTPRELMAYLGLTPSEHSSGGRKHQGSITKTGNGRVRRVLIEAAWHQRHRPCVSKTLRKRREGQPAWVIGQADKAMTRLHKRYRHLIQRGKNENVAVTAVARELAGFIWSVLHLDVECVREEVA